MKKYKIFVDGQVGTVGLEIHKRLAKHSEIEVLSIDENKRKDSNTRKEFINNSDIVFLCLPDDAAREAVQLMENQNTRMIDASTAHRTHSDWAYGIPELSSDHREKIKKWLLQKVNDDVYSKYSPDGPHVSPYYQCDTLKKYNKYYNNKDIEVTSTDQNLINDIEQAKKVRILDSDMNCSLI